MIDFNRNLSGWKTVLPWCRITGDADEDFVGLLVRGEPKNELWCCFVDFKSLQILSW
jgi:hypothetical protein